MRCSSSQPFSRPGLAFTLATFQRMKDGLCPVTPPVVLPPEFRPANQRRLDEIARLMRVNDVEDAGNAAAGPSGITPAEYASAIAENADAITVDAPGTATEDASSIAVPADTDPHTADEETNITDQETDSIIKETPTPEAAEKAMEPTGGVPHAPLTRPLPGKPTVEKEEERERGEELNEEAYNYLLEVEMEAREEDHFQSVLMSAPREKTYSQTRIAEKQRINDFLNDKRLSSKLPHHSQLPEEPSELELKLTLLQLEISRRNAGRTEVKKMRNANRGDPWDQ
eukprot:2019188-Pleurochrysis_carterae.AAC.2